MNCLADAFDALVLLVNPKDLEECPDVANHVVVIPMAVLVEMGYAGSDKRCVFISATMYVP